MRRERKILRSLWLLTVRELRLFARRPLLLFITLLVPLGSMFYFTSLMEQGLPTKLPAAIVDQDNTHISRIIARTLGAFEETDIQCHYPDFATAKQAMMRGEIMAFFHIPRGTTVDALSGKQARVSFYTNEAYFVPGTLLMKDMRYASELTGLALTREQLYARGRTERQAMGVIQPIVVETHPIHNSVLNYSVYLNNILIPGIMLLAIMLTTAYTVGLEWKQQTQRRWLRTAMGSPTLALAGKLWVQTLLFCLLFCFCDVYLYRMLLFPCHCGLGPMLLLGVAAVLAAQGFAVFLTGVCAGQMRLVMCLCSLWGILSFSITGFTYPVTAMAPILQGLAVLFPLRHYYLIYVNQALNGYPLHDVWTSVAAMAAFALLPLLVLPFYRGAIRRHNYRP